MQSKLLYLAVIGLMLFLFTLNKWFLATSILFIAFPFILNIFDSLNLKKVELKVKRIVKPISQEGSEIEVTIEIINAGEKIHWIEIEDLVDTELLAPDHYNKWLYSINKNEKKTLTYNIIAKRGFHQFKGVTITVADWFGINKHIKKYDIQSTIQVNPQMDTKDFIELKSKLLHGFSGFINSKRAGVGVDFFGLREYNNQDSLKNIHWRASAKIQDGFLVKQNLVTKNTTVMIDVDVRNRLLPKNNEFRLLEYSLRAARLFSDILIDDGHKVGLTIEQLDGAIILPAQSSNTQKLRINKSLAGVTEFQGLGPKSLVNMPEMFLRNSSTLILISPLEEQDTKYLLNLKRRGFKLICISPNYSSFVTQKENAEHIELKRKLMIDGLLQKGIIVIDWDISQPFTRCINQMNIVGRFLNEAQYSI